jgi:hypothetical protein
MSLFRVILRAIRERRLPMLAWSRGDNIRSRCPQCRAPVVLSEVREGERAFTCPACGVAGTWKADA